MRLCALVSAICVLTSSGVARTPGLDPKDMVRQVRLVHSCPGPLQFSNTARDDGEFLVDTSGASAEELPAGAFDGTNYLVVWRDDRNRDSTSDIYGSRVTRAGVVLDPVSFVISEAAGWQNTPALAFDGANFLVVWQEWHGVDSSDIYGCRVTPEGAVLDSGGIPISTAANGQEWPKVAFDGTNFLVVWVDGRDFDYDLYGCRVTPQGVVLDPSGFAICLETSVWYEPAVAFDGTNFLVVWVDGRGSDYDLYGCRVTPQGSVLDPSGIAICAVAAIKYDPAVAFDGANFLVVWADRRSDEDYDLYGSRVTPQGMVLDSSGFVVSQAAGDQLCPELVYDGTNFLVVWTDGILGEDDWDIYGCRVTPQGSVFGNGRVVTQEGIQWSPALTRGDGQVFLAYDGWAGMVGGRTYNANRVWGKMNPNPAIAEGKRPTVHGSRPSTTIVRGVLHLPASDVKRGASSALLDVAGRQVMEVRPGANAVSRLAPGVYFVRNAQAQAQAQAVTKVIVAR
jgi:hypothetical protein